MTTKITSANITQSGTSGISSVAWQDRIYVNGTGSSSIPATLTAGRAYPCDTSTASGGAFTVTLPASPAAGNVITLTDYAGTWGTNALTINPNGLKINGSTANGTVSTSRGAVSLVYVDSTQGWISYASNLATSIVQAITATGGNEVKTVGSYRYHIFTSSGTFTVTAGAGIAFEVMAAGGGGGGGAQVAGGGGGGELDLFTSVSASVNSYTVTVGSKGTGSSTGGTNGGTGGTSSFALGGTTYVSSLGGGGGAAGGNNGGNGGSGGGGSSDPGGSGGLASGSNTNAGGAGSNNGSIYVAGGGGGAGAGATGTAGSTSGNGSGGNGGAGYTLTNIDSNFTAANFTSFTGMTVICSGGGGGALKTPSGTAPTRGVGGTGAGSGGVNNGSSNTNTSSAATSFGSGGGGGAWSGGSPSNIGGSNGYDGVVIVRYLA